MTTSQMIDALLLHSLEIDPTDAEYATLRVRVLLRLQETVNDIWNFRDWWFKKGSSTVTIAANDHVGVCPSDFQRVARDGGVFLGPDPFGPKLREVTPHEMEELQHANVASSAPQAYSIYGLSDERAALLNIPPNPDEVVLIIHYDIKRPTLIDVDDVTSGLESIPAAYHEDVVQPGAIRLIRMDQENWQAVQAYEGLYRRALAQMAKAETAGKERVQKMPRFHGSHRAW